MASKGKINRPRGWKRSQRRLFPDLGVSRVCMEGFKHSRGQWGLPGGSAVKNLLALKEMQETWVQSLVGKIPWRRKYQPTPVFSAWRTPWTEALGRL